jgi:putative effector of murein hydrolase
MLFFTEMEWILKLVDSKKVSLGFVEWILKALDSKGLLLGQAAGGALLVAAQLAGWLSGSLATVVMAVFGLFTLLIASVYFVLAYESR